MVSLITAPSSSLQNGALERKEENSFYGAVKTFTERLELVRLPNKVISTLLTVVFRAEGLPLKKEWLNWIADRRFSIKSVTSTFALPDFFLKQIEFYQACSLLRRELMYRSSAKLDELVGAVKKTILPALAALLAGIRIPLMLDKTRIVDLSKASRLLPNRLMKGECLLSMLLSSLKIVDGSCTLYSQLKRGPTPNQLNSSSKMTETIVKLAANLIKLLSYSIGCAALFSGSRSNPIVLIAVSTISLCVSLVSKVVIRSKPIWGRNGTNSNFALASLPA